MVGGAGAFLGARGQVKGWGGTQFAQANAAPMAEDPVNRLTYHAAAKWRFTLHIIPMTMPQVNVTANPIVAASGQPDRGNSAHVRERWVDPARAAIVRAGEGTDPRHYRATP